MSAGRDPGELEGEEAGEWINGCRGFLMLWHLSGFAPQVMETQIDGLAGNV
jgi:hypothetical protein